MARRARESPVVLVNTFRELEEGVFAALDVLHSRAATDGQAYPKVIPIGPLLLPPDFPSPDSRVIDQDYESEEIASLMQWLDMQPPRSVLYIAFGTLVNNSREETEEIAHGLEASDQPFLWSTGSLKKTLNAPQPPTLAELLPPGIITICIVMKEDGNATSYHRIEDSLSRSRVALGLQTEMRLLDELHHGLGGDASATVAGEELTERRRAALLNQLAAKQRPILPPATGEQELILLLEPSHFLVPGTNLHVGRWVEVAWVRERHRWCPTGLPRLPASSCSESPGE